MRRVAALRPVAGLMSSTVSQLTSASRRPLSTAGTIRWASSSSPSASTSSSSSPSYSLPPLPYDYGALEPAISAQIMETHHKKHHQTYVTNLNNALAQLQEAQQRGDLTKQLALQSAVNFNGGGHVNHSIFWQNLAPRAQGGGAPPTGELLKAIEADFGDVAKLQAQMTAACLGVQGSGWGWLVYHPTQQRLQLLTKPNQDPVVDATPLLGIDVWEHVSRAAAAAACTTAARDQLPVADAVPPPVSHLSLSVSLSLSLSLCCRPTTTCTALRARSTSSRYGRW